MPAPEVNLIAIVFEKIVPLWPCELLVISGANIDALIGVLLQT